MLDKTYDAASIESRIYDLWEDTGAFRAGAGPRGGDDTYCIVIPPPNVTGSLHMGHALNNTLQDVLIRFERMRGKDVLWQPGTDHAGIATQMVVERQLAERQEPDRRTLGRETFVERIWEWKAHSGGTIINQLKRLGASCDWSRERFTMDEGLSKAVLKVFVALHKDDLIYKDKRLVNWDPKLHTAISDLEVQQVEMKGHLWHLRYPLEGGATYEAPVAWDEEGTPTAFETRDYIVVATTRPETMLGDTAVAVHPEDPRYKDLIGKNVVLPLTGRRIPIVGDHHADPEAGSGAVKITPAHDFNDFEVGKRHDLPQINILDIEANLVLDGNGDFLASLEESAELAETLKLHGVDRFEARKVIVERMDAAGLLDHIEDHTHMVPHGDRGGVPIEPYLTDQWYVDAATLAKPAIASVREGRTAFVPKTWEKTYFEWMENIQPWCISRQLWWGHQIPAWYAPAPRIDNGKLLFFPHDPVFFVEQTEADALSTADKMFAQTFGDRKIEWIEVSSPSEAEQVLRETAKKYVPGSTDPISYPYWRDPDVLDTWFSSALWPFSTLGWPDQTPELQRYYQTDVLITAFDIIFFWVARMMMMGLHFMDEEPFHTVYIHALVRDEKGQKMSKSKGNVIDPLELIDEYGADALRFTLAAMAAQGRDIKLAPTRVAGYRNFATKLWNATRFAEMNGCVRVAGFDPATAKEPVNRWIATETARCAAAVRDGLETYKFNEAAGSLYRFVWNTFCDWYLELAKPILTGPDGAAKDEVRATAAWAIDRILQLLHPFMPFVTEELWQRTGEDGPAREGMLIHTAWPELDFADTDAADELNWLVEVISAVRSVRAEMNVPAGARTPLVVLGADEALKARFDTQLPAIERLARVDDLAFADTAPAESAQIVIGAATICLPLAGVVDLDAERARLDKELKKIDGDITRIDKKLGNEQFLAKAPEEVVEGEREKREEFVQLRAKMVEARGRLGA
ncbi:valyl-tRNA synthetase [Rhodobium orientis]|uniref:Valine--tRNA ligase n=1 Tax=Rhodobium orientis TaxID=34017 RepID=A0A327K1A5_9HYPH|nr:valine--tRNA ligase [Rhodobium orientis]MBB4302572.1 valyl-tRNA synthetase [Rhodobium orientis]MBK5949420.1 valine--tRNA ligase [Rhodobium orientis]RAI29148.1 valine--tRNA ligase [Rhodobium orientis]